PAACGCPLGRTQDATGIPELFDEEISPAQLNRPEADRTDPTDRTDRSDQKNRGGAQITVPCMSTSMVGFFGLSVRSVSFPLNGPLAIPGLRVTRTWYSRPS